MSPAQAWRSTATAYLWEERVGESDEEKNEQVSWEMRKRRKHENTADKSRTGAQPRTPQDHEPRTKSTTDTRTHGWMSFRVWIPRELFSYQPSAPMGGSRDSNLILVAKV